MTANEILRALICLFVLSPVLSQVAGADGLAVPARGEIRVIDLAQVRYSRSLEVAGDSVPVLAVHPQDSVLASVSAGRLKFWNLPDLSEASELEESLFQDVVAATFSPDGQRLFLLSESLKAVLVYSLANSEVSAVWPVPGSKPFSLKAEQGWLAVHQEGGAAFLDLNDGSLALQLLYPSQVAGSHLNPNLVLLPAPGGGGIERYRRKNGARLENAGGGGAYGRLVGSPDGSHLYAVHESESALECWTPGVDQMVWSVPLTQGPHELVVSRDGRWIYVVSRSMKSLTVVQAADGQEIGRLPLQDLQGRPVLFGTSSL